VKSLGSSSTTHACWTWRSRRSTSGPDSRHATVKIAARGDERKQNQALAGLEHASGHLRRELAFRLQLRHVPELRFELNRDPDTESRIDFLVRRAKKSRARDEKQP